MKYYKYIIINIVITIIMTIITISIYNKYVNQIKENFTIDEEGAKNLGIYNAIRILKNIEDKETLNVKNLNVKGNANIEGKIDTKNNINVGKNINVKGKAEVDGKIDTKNNINVGKNINVKGNANIEGIIDTNNINVGKNISVKGKAEVYGKMEVRDKIQGKYFKLNGKQISHNEAKGDGTIYRNNGQVHIGCDDWIYFKDNNHNREMKFEVKRARIIDDFGRRFIKK